MLNHIRPFLGILSKRIWVTGNLNDAFQLSKVRYGHDGEELMSLVHARNQRTVFQVVYNPESSNK